MNARTVCWLTLGLAAAAFMMDPINDPDLWWHLTAGRWIVAHQDIPQVEIWNRFSEGIPWKAYSWSSEAVLAVVYGTFGIGGLIVLKYSLAAALVFSLMFCLGRAAGNMILGAALGLIVAAGCDVTFTLRPQCLAWVFFTWMIFSANTLKHKPASVLGWLGLAALSTAWANTHLTVLLGIAAVAAWLVQFPLNAKTVALPAAALAAAFGATLITPYAGQEWATLFNKAHHPFQHFYIREFQPPTAFMYSVDILALLLVLFAVIWHRRPASIRPGQLLGAAVFGIAGFTILKFTPFALIYSGFLIADIWANRGKKSQQGELEKGIAEGIELLGELRPKTLTVISVLCLLLSAAAFAPLVRKPLSSVVPEQAVDFIIENNLPMPILNGFDDGGYLMFRFSDDAGKPRELVPLDGRTNVNSPKVTEAFIEALQGKPGWKALIDIVQPKTILWDTGFPLTAILDSHPDWCLVYPEKRENLIFSTRAVFVEKELCEMVRANAYQIKPDRSFLGAEASENKAEVDSPTVDPEQPH